MIAPTQRKTAPFQLAASDLESVLALVRAGTLAGAGERLDVDPSTVFRTLQRIERGLGQALFLRSRTGYQALELAQALAAHAEQLESALESARSAAQAQQPGQVAGTVRITTTDTILHALVAPALQTLQGQHPLLQFELHAGNDLASLTRRDTDIAVRATRRPPAHLVGRQVGPIRMALYAARQGPVQQLADVHPGQDWVAPDDALPEHPSVLWRKRHFPKAVARYRVGSILTVMELVALGLGVGVLPIFLAQHHPGLVALSGALDECETGLWLLTHPESRHLRRVGTVYGHLARSLVLE